MKTNGYKTHLPIELSLWASHEKQSYMCNKCSQIHTQTLLFLVNQKIQCNQSNLQPNESYKPVILLNQLVSLMNSHCL